MKNFRLPVLFLLSAGLWLLSGCGLWDESDVFPTLTPTAVLTATATPVPQPTLSPTPTPLVARGTITLWHSFTEEEMPALVQVISGFQQQYPEVLFDVLYVPLDDLRNRYEIAVREGGGPTILIGPADWGPPLYQAGYTADLFPLAAPELLDPLNPAALQASRYQDALVGLPYALEGVVLYRNKDLIGVSPDTFNQLASLAQSATQGEIVGAFLERGFLYSGGHLEGIGGHLMDASGGPLFNDEKGQEWLNLLLGFDKAGPTTYNTDQDLDAFKDGRVGWIIDGTWNLSALIEALGADNLAIDPWPTYGDGHLSGYVRPENLYLSSLASGDHAVASWKFMEYFVSEDVQTTLANYEYIPAASGVMMIDPVNGPLITQAITALAGGAAYPVLSELQAYTIPLDTVMKGVFFDAAPPDQALSAAYDAVWVGLGLMRSTETPTPAPVLTPTPASSPAP